MLMYFPAILDIVYKMTEDNIDEVINSCDSLLLVNLPETNYIKKLRENTSLMGIFSPCQAFCLRLAIWMAFLRAALKEFRKIIVAFDFSRQTS